MLKKMLNYFLLLMLLAVISIPIVTMFRKQPTMAVAIRSWSMSPLLTRGDLVLLRPVGVNSRFSEGQIVVFRPAGHIDAEWTMHRIVGVDAAGGFITRGDANEYTDQQSLFPPLQPEWIAGVALTVRGAPIKIPLLGYIPLCMEKYLSRRGFIPILVSILALVLAADEIFKKRRGRKKETISKAHLFFLGGAVVAVLMASLMLAGSIFITFPYGVEESAGALMGSDVGVLELGKTRRLELAELSNGGLLPSYYYAFSADPQVVLEESDFRISPGESAVVQGTVFAREQGLHQARVTVGMFLPFLPWSLLRFLVEKSYWLGLAAVSLTPALPLFAFPFLDRSYRRRYVKVRRKILRRAEAFFAR